MCSRLRVHLPALSDTGEAELELTCRGLSTKLLLLTCTFWKALHLRVTGGFRIQIKEKSKRRREEKGLHVVVGHSGDPDRVFSVRRAPFVQVKRTVFN